VRRTPFDPAAILSRLAADTAACGDFDLRIDRRGRWHHQGILIERPALVALLASVLHRAPDGSHWLVTPAEQGRVEVDDAAFVAVELARSGSGTSQTLTFRTNLDAWVSAGPGHRLRCRPGPGGDLTPYLEVGRGLEARVLQPVYYELAELAVAASAGALGVWSGGILHVLDRPVT
jgi:hypothetical protein